MNLTSFTRIHTMNVTSFTRIHTINLTSFTCIQAMNMTSFTDFTRIYTINLTSFTRIQTVNVENKAYASEQEKHTRKATVNRKTEHVTVSRWGCGGWSYCCITSLPNAALSAPVKDASYCHRGRVPAVVLHFLDEKC